MNKLSIYLSAKTQVTCIKSILNFDHGEVWKVPDSFWEIIALDEAHINIHFYFNIKGMIGE